MRSGTVALTCAAAVAALSFAAAQTPARGTAAGRGGVPGPDVWGTWDPMGRCFPNGEDCPWKLEDIPLNDRAVAHRETFDETIAPKYDCVEATTPGIVGDPYMMTLERRADRVLIHYEKDDVTRTAWLDGRKPRVNEYTWQGFASARIEGNALVVETTNFLYDPTGLDDMAGLPSSTRKKVIERYTRDGNLLRATVTTEDPLFLVAPAVYATQWRQAPPGAKMETFACDAAEARQPLQFLPPKYKHVRTVPKRWQ
jgi:hypothetical protein